MRYLKILIVALTTLIISSCHNDAEGPVIEIYKFRGPYEDKVCIRTEKTDSMKVSALPNANNPTRQMPIKLLNGYYAKGTLGIRSAYLSMTWDEYKTYFGHENVDTLLSLIIDRHPFSEYWEDQDDVLYDPYHDFDTAKLNRIITNGEMDKYFKRIQ